MYQASTTGKPAALRSHINNGRTLRSPRGKTPWKLYELGPTDSAANDRSYIRRPYVVARFEIRRPAFHHKFYFQMAECIEIGVIRNVVSIVVAHLSTVAS